MIVILRKIDMKKIYKCTNINKIITGDKDFCKGWSYKGENDSNMYTETKIKIDYELPNDILLNIITDYTQNFISIMNISKKYKISNDKIRNILKENNIEIAQYYLSKENENKIIKMYVEDKLSTTKISNFFPYGRNHISKILKNNNIKVNRNKD